MQTYSITFHKRADRFLASLSKKERARILEKIYGLPNQGDRIKMKGEKDTYRLRVGDYRVIYEVHEDKIVVLILNIGNRGDVYK